MAAVSRKSIADYISNSLGAREVVLLDDFETVNARHVCHGSRCISILPKRYMNVVLPNGVDCLRVDYFFCRVCGKLLLNKDSLTVVGNTSINMSKLDLNHYESAQWGMADPNLMYSNGIREQQRRERMLEERDRLRGSGGDPYGDPYGRGYNDAPEYPLLGPDDNINF